MKAVYLHDWAKSKKKALIENFKIHANDLKDVEILLASYSLDFESGNAFVLFRKDGKLYEVNAGHCSCYGLEGQWEPEETSIRALKFRMYEGELGKNLFFDELKEVLINLINGF